MDPQLRIKMGEQVDDCEVYDVATDDQLAWPSWLVLVADPQTGKLPGGSMTVTVPGLADRPLRRKGQPKP